MLVIAVKHCWLCCCCYCLGWKDCSWVGLFVNECLTQNVGKPNQINVETKMFHDLVFTSHLVQYQIMEHFCFNINLVGPTAIFPTQAIATQPTMFNSYNASREILVVGSPNELLVRFVILASCTNDANHQPLCETMSEIRNIINASGNDTTLLTSPIFANPNDPQQPIKLTKMELQKRSIIDRIKTFIDLLQTEHRSDNSGVMTHYNLFDSTKFKEKHHFCLTFLAINIIYFTANFNQTPGIIFGGLNQSSTSAITNVFYQPIVWD